MIVLRDHEKVTITRMWAHVFTVFAIVLFLLKWLLGLKPKLRNEKQPTNKDGTQALKKKIPGMKPTDPETGNQSDRLKAKTPGHFLCELHKKYGPIASFWEGKKLAVSVSDPNLFKQLKYLYIQPEEAFPGLRLIGGKELLAFTDIEEIWRRRKIYEHHFMTRACQTYTSCFIKLAQKYIKKWESLDKSDHLPLVKATSGASLEAISQSTFGDIFEDKKEMQQFHELNDDVFLKVEPVPSPDSLEYKPLIQNIDKLRTIVKKALNLRKKTKKEKDDRFFIDVLIEEEFTDEQRLADALVMITAGYKNSATHMATTLFHLCKNQDIQERLYQHIVSIAGNEPITSEVIPKLTYLKQVLEEGLRHFLMYFFLARKTHEDLILDGYFIPKDTNIYNAMGMTRSDPKYFPNPEKFNPDHFTPENVRLRHAFAYKPFGYAGKRQCLGQIFAMTEASVFIAEWCRRFRFSLAPGQKEDISFKSSFVPVEEIWVTLEKRAKPALKPILKNCQY